MYGNSLNPGKTHVVGKKTTELNRYFTEGKLVFVSLIPARKYPEFMDSITKFASGKWKKICMVSLTKPCSTLVESFKRAGIDPKKFFIVDAISQTAGGAEKADNVAFVSSPAAVTELGIKIGETLKKDRPEFLIFDSISVMLIYVQEQEVLKFIHTLVSRFRASGIRSLFTVLLEDTETRVVRNICMFADAIIDLGEG
ncbi:MAG: hypothetical protein QXG10_03675 [Candidatus Hadarchaeales archaeon]